MKKDFISPRLIYYLISIFLISLIFYFIISTQTRIEDLLINIAATVAGIIITLLLVERSIKKAEKKEWEELEQIISNQIIDILFTLCNFLNISSNLWHEWTQIFNKVITKKEKIKEYVKIFQSLEINKDYIYEIIKDDHLIGFFSSGYNATYKRLDDFFRLYSSRLNAVQTTQIIHLKMNISSLTSHISLFQSLNFILKEYKLPIEESHVNDFLKNAKETILTVNKLVGTI